MVPGVARRVEVFPDLDAASRALARHLRSAARVAVAERGRFSLVLSGGRTPIGMFRLLAGRDGRTWPWAKTEIYFADERCVAPDDPQSNFGGAWATLLSRVAIPGRSVHRILGELPRPSEAARRYSRLLGRIGVPSARARPRFDLALLGVGPDGHTASVFPGSLAAHDLRARAVGVDRPAQPPFVPRVTLTPPALSWAQEVCFLASGPDKAWAIAQTLAAPPTGDARWPASQVRPSGPVAWYLDRAAAAELTGDRLRGRSRPRASPRRR